MLEQERRPRAGKPDPSNWIADALATARLQRLNPSMAAGGEMINRARAHLRSADMISATDPALAVSLATTPPGKPSQRTCARPVTELPMKQEPTVWLSSTPRLFCRT